MMTNMKNLHSPIIKKLRAEVKELKSDKKYWQGRFDTLQEEKSEETEKVKHDLDIITEKYEVLIGSLKSEIRFYRDIFEMISIPAEKMQQLDEARMRRVREEEMGLRPRGFNR